MIKEALKAPKHIRIQRKEEQNDEFQGRLWRMPGEYANKE